MKLPLELVAVMADIRKELDFNGYGCIVKSDGTVDFKLSVYEVLNHINAIFPNCELPFVYMFESACSYVNEWKEHIEKTYKREKIYKRN